MPSNVYFTDFHTTAAENQLQKLKRLMLTAGARQIDWKGKFVAIKIHFGEPGNLAFLRPNYARAVADVIKELGGKPFLTDCNTLYVGGRKNALEHIESAYQNGFTPYTTGCHILIADGLKGNDEVAVPVQGGDYIKEAKIGRALMDADIKVKGKQVVWIDSDEIAEMRDDCSRILKRIKGCTACVCYNDEVANKLVGICMDQGIRIPDDLSIVGIDNSDLSRFCEIPFTSADNPVQELGKIAAEMMIDKIQGIGDIETVELMPDLVMRNSVKVITHI